MEEEKEVKETKKKKSNNNKPIRIMIVIIVLLLGIIIGGVASEVGFSFTKKVDNQESNVVDIDNTVSDNNIVSNDQVNPVTSNESTSNNVDTQTTPTQKKDIAFETKYKLEKFVKTASIFNYSGTGTAKIFYDGVTASNLSKNTKIIMAYNLTGTYTVSELPSNVTPVFPSEQNEVFYVLSLGLFNDNYKELFNESTPVTVEEIKSVIKCPMAFANDSFSIYFVSRCGGTGDSSLVGVITGYDSDDNYYYVYQDVEYYTPAEKTYKTIVWKFDKSLNFISTSNK